MPLNPNKDETACPSEGAATPPVKVGIITFHFVRNFGGVLQASALTAFVRSLGAEATILNYCPAYIQDGGSFRIPDSRSAMRGNLVSLYQRSKRWRQRLFGDANQNSAFELFQDSFLPTTKRFESWEEMSDSRLDFQLMICGSDQIWNPSPQHGVDPAYFLRFGPESALRISYAASFGKATVPRHSIAKISQYASELDAVTVRESSGIPLLAAQGVTNVRTMPDPTLLINDYSEMMATCAAEDTANDYVFVYGLRSPEGFAETVSQIARHRNLRIRRAYAMRLGPQFGARYEFPGPAQWLQLIANAKYVVTNSYHGTLFSILFRKPFVTLSIGSGKSAYDERVIDVLSKLGIPERLVSTNDTDAVQSLLTIDIDWSEVERRRKQLVADASEYLNHWIEAAKTGSEHTCAASGHK